MIPSRPHSNTTPASEPPYSSSSHLQNISPEAYRETIEGYLWIVGTQWQGYLGDPNPYRKAREWEAEGRRLKGLWDIIWEEEEATWI